MMATEIKNLQEGKELQISNGIKKTLKETEEKLHKSEAEKGDLEAKVKEAEKDNEQAKETIKTLTKVVESVFNNEKELNKNNKSKKHVKCRDFNKPSGCGWGDRCKFGHGEACELGKKSECSYRMDGRCRYSQKVCWNNHDPNKKRINSNKDREDNIKVFQEGGEEMSGPPGQENSACSLDAENWRVSRSRKMTAMAWEKERQEEPGMVDGQVTQTFPMDGKPAKIRQQALLDVLHCLLQHAGGSQ